MTKISSLGYPRLGENREWKKLIEAYWADNISQEDLFAQAKDLRTSFLTKQLEAGLDLIPVGDFSLYDHILDLSLQFNIIPERFRDLPLDIDLYFAVARGNKANVASALKKWFNTNYHYIVLEWTPTTLLAVMMIIWKEWKKKSRRLWGLLKLGLPKWVADKVSGWGDHYQLVAQKSVLKRAISKPVLTKRGLVFCLDYYLDRHALKGS